MWEVLQNITNMLYETTGNDIYNDDNVCERTLKQRV